MTTVELSVWAFVAELTQRVKRGINLALPILLEELKRLTPEDTGNMLDSYKVEQATEKDGKIVGVIYNEAKYAIYVEYGVRWLVYTYHKPKWTAFYDGVGNRTFARAVDNVRSEVEQAVLSEVDR